MYRCINGWTKDRMLEVVTNRPFEEAAYCDKREECYYIMPNGNRCAVGLFIPNDHPALKESMGVVAVCGKYRGLLEILPLELSGMQDFQLAHDLNKENAKTKMIEWIQTNVEG